MFKKLALLLSILLCISFSVIIATVLGSISELVRSNITDAHQQAMDNLAYTIDGTIRSNQRALLSCAVAPELQSGLRRLVRGEAGEEVFAEFHRITRSSLPELIAGMTVVPLREGRPLCLISGEEVRWSVPAEAGAWIEAAAARNGRLCSSMVERGEKTYLRLAQAVTDTEGWQTQLGVIAMDMDFDAFIASLNLSGSQQSSCVVFLDREGEIQYPYRLPTGLSPELVRAAAGEEVSSLEEYISMSAPIRLIDWTLVKFWPVTQVQSKFITLRNSILLTGILTGLCSLLIALAISYENFKPVDRLIRTMKRDPYISKIAIPPNLPRDYLFLYRTYNAMVDRIDSLIDRIFDMTSREKETELKMLQAQINPHFLYNVLDSINWLARKRQAEDISTMVSSLATMLRCGLNSGKEITSVARELSQVESYLAIQNIRYDNQFEAHSRFDPEALSRSIIRLILQPLVENALIHGFETWEGARVLVVSGRITGAGALHLQVKNTGNRLNLERIHRLLTEEHPTGKSYGIRNVNERLIKKYGPSAGLRYAVREEWNIVDIEIPAQPMPASSEREELTS